MDAGNINVINCINYGNVEGRGYGIGGILGYITNNGEIIKIENSCNFGNINVISSGISYSGTGGIIDLNQYSSTQIELNNSFSIGDIERKATYKANLIGNNNGRKNTSWLFI